MEIFYTKICLLASLCLLGIMLLRHGLRDPLTAIAIFYFYFAFGPVVNHLMGWEIYFGTIRGKIFEASIIFSLAIFGFFVASMTLKLKKPPNIDDLKVIKLSPSILLVILSFSLLIGLYQLQNVLGLVTGGSLFKNALIQQAGASVHRAYLFTQFCILPLYFFVRNTKLSPLFMFNFVVYIFYCLLTSERDFTLVVISILLYRMLLEGQSLNIKQKRQELGSKKIRLILAVVSMVMIAVVIAVRRSAENSSYFELAGFLNQGSILFINTQILQMTQDGVPHMWGDTYRHSLLNLLPSWIYTTNFYLSSWFKDIYAPSGTSGYGFALDAEAYLNFGYVGVPVFFFLFGWFQRQIFNRLKRHAFYLYFSVFFMPFSMYSLRNDSLALIKGSIYASLFFVGIMTLSRFTAKKRRSVGHWHQVLQPSDMQVMLQKNNQKRRVTE